MGIVTSERVSNLYWLGRYVDRVSSTIKVFCPLYDKSVDSIAFEYADVCAKLGVPDIYTSSENFIQSFGFDKQNPDSIISSLIRAYDNAMILRDEIGSDVLSYIHMAMEAMGRCEKNSPHPLVELQRVLDDLMAFWGCLDDVIDSQSVRNIVKIGKTIERLDFALRFERPKNELSRCLNAFSARIDTTPIVYNKSAFLHVSAIVESDEIDYKAALMKSYEIISI